MDATTKHRLLVVDDDASVLLTYQLLLQEQGYEVNAAISSKKAKEELRRSNFDVVLCDLSLEQDRTGFEVFEFARQMYPAIPCVLLTGYANKEATDRARSYFTGYPPSSPSIGILRDGKLVYMMQRSDIETREAAEIAANLRAAFEKFCGKALSESR